MKRIIRVMCIFMACLLLTGCGNNKNITAPLDVVMEKLYAGIGDDEKPMLSNIEIDKENISNFVGTDKIKFEEALASEPNIGSIAHSVVLVRVDKNEDIEEVKQEIKDNVNPRKWLCVGVEPEDVYIKNKGNLILVVIVEDETIRNKVSEAFDNL